MILSLLLVFRRPRGRDSAVSGCTFQGAGYILSDFISNHILTIYEPYTGYQPYMNYILTIYRPGRITQITQITQITSADLEAKNTHRWIPSAIKIHQTLKSAGANSRTLALRSCSNWLRCPRPGCHHLQNPLGYNWRQCRGSGCRQGFSGLVNDEKIAVWKALNQKRDGLRLIAFGNLLWHCLGKLLWSKGCWKKDSLQEWSSTRDMCNSYKLIVTICRLHVIIRNWSFLTGKPWETYVFFGYHYH